MFRLWECAGDVVGAVVGEFAVEGDGEDSFGSDFDDGGDVFLDLVLDQGNPFAEQCQLPLEWM